MTKFLYHLNGVVPVVVVVAVDRAHNEPALESVSIAGIELDDLTAVGELRDGQWVALETILSEIAADLLPDIIAGQRAHERETSRAIH